nr:hypothetical protein 4 [Cardiobacteriales bacterium]
MSLINDLWEKAKELTSDALDVVEKIIVEAFDSILSGIAALIEALPVPNFLSNGLQFYLQDVSPDILYFLDKSSFPQAMALIGLGVAFKLTRKALTLFQW